jgi:hypothetical protein
MNIKEIQMLLIEKEKTKKKAKKKLHQLFELPCKKNKACSCGCVNDKKTKKKK